MRTFLLHDCHIWWPFLCFHTPTITFSFQNKTLSSLMECSFFSSWTQYWTGKINHPVYTLIMVGCSLASQTSPSLRHPLHFTCSFHLPLPICCYVHLLFSCSSFRLRALSDRHCLLALPLYALGFSLVEHDSLPLFLSYQISHWH